MMKRADGEGALRRSMEITWHREVVWVLVRISLFNFVSARTWPLFLWPGMDTGRASDSGE